MNKHREVQPEHLLQTRGTSRSLTPFFSVHCSLQLPCTIPGCAVTQQEMCFQLHPSHRLESSKSGCVPGHYSRSRKHFEPSLLFRYPFPIPTAEKAAGWLAANRAVLIYQTALTITMKWFKIKIMIIVILQTFYLDAI